MSSKERLSASVDVELIAAGRRVVASGQAENFSAWVNEALQRQVAHDQRLRALDDFLAAYEAEHGEITESEIRDTTRNVRARAVIVRREPKGEQREAGRQGAL